MRVAEPTKVCAGCKNRRAWSQFYAKVKWPDGTMRQPQARCKQCANKYTAEWHRKKRQRDPEWQRRRQQLAYRRLKADPERYHADVARRREWARRRFGYTRDLRKTQRTSEVVPVTPFARWLRKVMKRDYTTIRETAARLGMEFHTMKEILRESRDVDVEIVERALIVDNTITLRDLYPSLYEVAA